MGDFPPFRRTQTFAAAFLLLCLLAALPKPATAQGYMFTFSGDYRTGQYEAYGYDGTDYYDLPPSLDFAALAGGTFTATMFVPATVAPTDPTFNYAGYDFTPASTIQYTLYDAAGNVRHQSSGSAGFTYAGVSHHIPSYDGMGGLQGYFDGVDFGSYGGRTQVSGLTPPQAVYSPQLEFSSLTQLTFNNFSDLSHEYLSNLTLPTNGATYLNFPSRGFYADLLFGDGDYFNQEDPFQFVETSVFYNVNRVQVTAVVPEPSQTAAFLVGGMLLFLYAGCRRFKINLKKENRSCL